MNIGLQFGAVYITTFAILCLLAVSTVHAEGSGEKPDWDRIKKEADAETAALEAQKKLIETRRALDAAQAGPDANAAAVAAKTRAETEKAAAEARKAAAEADAARLKTLSGEIPGSGYKGDVTPGANTGQAESQLLAAVALREAAERISTAVRENATPDKPILVYGGSEFPNFQSLAAFRAQEAMVKKGFSDAATASQTADSEAPEPVKPAVEAIPPAVAAGIALDALNKLLGYFRTDYTTQSVTVTAQTDAMLVQAVAGRLVKGGSGDRKVEVRLPGTFAREWVSAAQSDILMSLESLLAKKSEGFEKIRRHDRLQSRYTELAGKEPNAEEKKKLERNAALHKAASDSWKAAITVLDVVFGKLSGADEKGTIPLAQVVKDSVVFHALEDGASLLLLQVHASVGSYYTQKNMWTLFGGMPLHHMGGTITGFVLIDGKTGKVLAAGEQSVHGGYVRSKEVRKLVNSAAATVSK